MPLDYKSNNVRGCLRKWPMPKSTSNISLSIRWKRSIIKRLSDLKSRRINWKKSWRLLPKVKMKRYRQWLRRIKRCRRWKGKNNSLKVNSDSSRRDKNSKMALRKWSKIRKGELEIWIKRSKVSNYKNCSSIKGWNKRRKGSKNSKLIDTKNLWWWKNRISKKITNCVD